MRTDDFRINAKVRSILVRRWIDTSKCNFGTIKGRVFIRGHLIRLYSKMQREEEEDSNKNREETSIQEKRGELALIQLIEDEIRRIPNVSGVQFDLENWRKERGEWQPRVND